MRTLAPLLLLLAAGAVDAQAPKCWKNDRGVTECGTRPPPGVEARTIEVKRPATPTAATSDEEALRAAVIEQCGRARATLADYQRADYLFETDASGERRVLSVEEMAAARMQAERAVAERCAGLPDPES